jgi:hypothetical protein
MSTLSRKTGFFHIFISYQVASDSNFAENLYYKLLSLSNSLQVPYSETFFWPREFLRSDSSLLRVFFDKKCLAPGQPWDWAGSINSGGFIGALNKSIVVVPVISIGVDGDGILTGSLGRLLRFGYQSFNISRGMPTSTLTVGNKFWFSSQNQIPNLPLFVPFVVTAIHGFDVYAEVDSPLASLRKLIRCKSDSIHILSDDRQSIICDISTTNSISVSVYVSCNNDSSQPVDNVLFEWLLALTLNSMKSNDGQALRPCRSIFPLFCGGLHGEKPIASLYKVKALLSNGTPSQTTTRLLSIFTDLKLNCPVTHDFMKLDSIISSLLKFQGHEFSDSMDSLCSSVFSSISIALDEDIAAFDSNKPMAAELREFLASQRAKYMLPALARHQVTSINDLSYFEPHSYSMACFIKDASMSLRQSEVDLSLHLSKVVVAAKASDKALPLSVRLRLFRDPHVDWFTAATSTSGLDLVLCKPFFLVVTVCVSIAASVSGWISYSTFGFLQNALTLLVLALGGFVASATTYFIHPSVGRHCLAIMFAMLVPASLYSWHLDRQAGYSSCMREQSSGNLLSSIEECGAFMTFPILTVQLILYIGNAVNAKFKQNLFWYFVAVVCAILNACYLYFDINVRKTELSAKFFDAAYILFCGLLVFVILIRRRKSLAEALKSSQNDALFLNNLWNQYPENDKVDFDRVFDTLDDDIQQVVDRQNNAVSELHQECDDINEIYDRGQFVNASFQEMIESWFDSVPDQHYCDPESTHAHSFNLKLSALADDVTVVRGPIKLPARAISKVYRTYKYDSSRLTDVVRCSVVCSNLKTISAITSRICASGIAKANVSSSIYQRVLSFFQNSQKEETIIPMTCLNASSSPTTGLFEICRIRNRFHSSYDARDGYRDISFKLKMGFEESTSGGCWFVPVELWTLKKASVKTLICELQLKLKLKDQSYEHQQAMHSHYVERRNLLSQ